MFQSGIWHRTHDTFLHRYFFPMWGLGLLFKFLPCLALSTPEPLYNVGVIIGLSTMNNPPRNGIDIDIDIDISSSLWGTNPQTGTSACRERQMN